MCITATMNKLRHRAYKCNDVLFTFFFTPIDLWTIMAAVTWNWSITGGLSMMNAYRRVRSCSIFIIEKGRSCSWSYASWIYNYLCNQCLSPPLLWVLTPLRRGVLDTTLCDEVCQWLATGQWSYPGTPISSTNKTDRHDITEILLTVALKHHNTNPDPNRKITSVVMFVCELLVLVSVFCVNILFKSRIMSK